MKFNRHMLHKENWPNLNVPTAPDGGHLQSAAAVAGPKSPGLTAPPRAPDIPPSTTVLPIAQADAREHRPAGDSNTDRRQADVNQSKLSYQTRLGGCAWSRRVGIQAAAGAQPNKGAHTHTHATHTHTCTYALTHTYTHTHTHTHTHTVLALLSGCLAL